VDRLTQRLEIAARALTTLDEILTSKTPDKIVRDAGIQRFEYSFEAVWKAAQAVLREKYGLPLGSPKPVVRACFENALLTEEQARSALAMVDHRNLTAHTYNEQLADEIFSALPGYAKLMRAWLARLAVA